MSSLIRVLRVLDAVPGLENLIPASGPRPMDLLQRKGKIRERASGRRGGKSSDKPWRWDDNA
jgi:hypothetical protein